MPGAALVLILSGAEPAFAHKLLVFATADGATIEGQAYFAGGQPARGARVQVLAADGTPLAELTPDAEGRFTYQARTAAEHRIVADGADGHRAEWRIGADELAGAVGGAAAVAVAAPATAGPAAAAPARDAATDVPPAADAANSTVAAPSPALIAAIERAVARQVRPLREELAAAQARARLTDVLGGIGYIVGLTGLALWWLRRRPAAGSNPNDPRPGDSRPDDPHRSA